MAVRVACGQCHCTTLIRGQHADIECDVCSHELGWKDLYEHLYEDELYVFDDDGYLAVERRELLYSEEN